MNTTWNKSSGFTLIELLVVVAMIGIIAAAMGTSVAAAQERARIQKATAEVRMVHQAILAYENFARGGDYKLEAMTDEEADINTLGFLLGKGESADSGGKIPVLLQAALSSGNKMRDPWGTPYTVTVREGGGGDVESPFSNLSTGYGVPNFYRLSEEERK